MHTEHIIVTIRIQGSLPERWKDWFDALTLTNLDNGEILMQGQIQDQSILIGIINQIHNLNLRLIAVNCEQTIVVQTEALK
jgi:hypothetical protein